MKIHVNVELTHGGRSGIEARAPELKLTSHGLDKEEAIQSLKRGIIAWCEGLQSLERLEQTIKQKQLKWEPNGQTIEVEMVKSEEKSC